MNHKSISGSLKRSSHQAATCCAVIAGITLANPSYVEGAALFENFAFDGGSLAFDNSSGTTWGFDFKVTSPVTVTDLGIWNNNSGDGLIDSHTVSIWDDAVPGVPLASVTIPARTTSVVEEFSYGSLTTSLTLSPGTTYVLGASYPTRVSGGDFVAFVPQFSLGSVFTAVHSRSSDAVFPVASDPASSVLDGGFGPNFLFDASPAPVPEPETYAAFFAVGMLGFAAWRRRNRGKAAALATADPR